ncbi:MAG: cation-translocating P-type ATPase [Pirellulales bacterium]
MSEAHAEAIHDFIQRLDTDASIGLKSEEVAKRREKFGRNELAEAAPVPMWRRLVGQFQGLVIWLLIISAVIAGAMGEWVDTIAILTIVVLNGLLGFFQEERAEEALAALRKMSAPQARVRRDGNVQMIDAGELVPGDVIELESGDFVPADARLVKAFGLRTQESSLTGESTTVEKNADAALAEDTPLAERENMLFLGTTVASGKAVAIVSSTGMQTELGGIAGLLQQTETEETPLQRRLGELGRVMVTGCLVITAVIFVVQMLRHGNIVEVFLTSISLAVAAVPEGLPAVVTITLAIGLQRMAKRNALIRRLPSVETLGCVTVICSDKTGTLTRNEMTVRELWLSGHTWEISGEGYSPSGDVQLRLHDGRDRTGFEDAAKSHPELHADLQWMLQVGSLCNTAKWQWSHEEQRAEKFGDPTEIALHVAAHKADARPSSSEHEVLHEMPFDSDRKMMSQVNQFPGGERRMLAKGAPEVIWRRCDQIRDAGRDRPITDEDRRAIQAANDHMAAASLRVLGLAYRDAGQDAGDWKSEQGLVFLGLIGMIDPPRSEVAAAVERCRSAGIRPVMITGDHPQTAKAIAESLTIASEGAKAVTGGELDRMDDAQLERDIEQVSVYARVTAEHKLRIVKAWRKRGQVVAMTGDGVNDAPAVKTADIGIVMGITGTDVTKEAADMVLTDDNFASIINAVEEGRGIYENIQKFLYFLLACNVSEVLFMFTASVIGVPSPLLPVQILWINLVTDGLPAIALAMEPLEKHLMKRKPRPVNEPVLPRARLWNIALHGSIMAAVGLLAFFLIRTDDEEGLMRARTAAFTTMTLTQIFFSIGCRSFSKTMPQIGPFTNPTLVAAMAGSMLLQILVVSIPFTASILEVSPLGWSDWLTLILLSLVPVSIVEIVKLVVLRAPVEKEPT